MTISVVQITHGEVTYLGTAGAWGGPTFASPPTAGNLLLASWHAIDTGCGTMAGWTPVVTNIYDSHIHTSVSLFSKISDGSETGPITMASSSWTTATAAPGNYEAWIVEIAGVDTLDTYVTETGPDHSADPGAPITPTTGRNVIVYTFQNWGGTYGLTGWGDEAAVDVVDYFGDPTVPAVAYDVPKYWIGHSIITPADGSAYDINPYWTATPLGNSYASISAAFYSSGPPPEPGIDIDVYDPDDNFLGVIEEAAWPVPKTMRWELHGTGSGAFSIRRDHPDVGLIGQGNLCRLTVPRIDSAPIGAFFVETRKTTVLSEQETGDEIVRVGGRGILSYIDRAVAHEVSYVVPAGVVPGGVHTGPASTGNVAGQILYRAMLEYQHVDRPEQPIPLATYDFTSAVDSNGDPWEDTDLTGELSVGYVGERGLVGVFELEGTNQLDVIMLPTYELLGLNHYGRDLTGTSFGAGVVRFVKGVNIATRLEREFGPDLPTTHLLVKGTGDVYGRGVLTDAASRPTVEGFVAAEGETEAFLDLVADGELARQFRRGEAVQFDVLVPFTNDDLDEAAGQYLPGPEGSDNGSYWIGDTVTIHTGTDFDDLDNEDARIEALNITVDDANNLKIAVWLKATTLVGRGAPSIGTPGVHSGGGGGATTGGSGGTAPAPQPGVSATQLLAHVNDTIDAHNASAVSVVPFSTIAATNVQTALEEIVAEATGGGGGSMVWLQRQTASASATLDFTGFISSTYDAYFFVFKSLVMATNSVNLWMRMGTGGGPTYDTGANYSYDLFVWRAGGSAFGGGTGQTKITLDYSASDSINNGTAALAGVQGHAYLFDPMSTALYKQVEGQIVYYDAAPFRVTNQFRAGYDSTTAVTAVRFMASSGNITSGSIDVYGLTHA